MLVMPTFHIVKTHTHTLTHMHTNTQPQSISHTLMREREREMELSILASGIRKRTKVPIQYTSGVHI